MSERLQSAGDAEAEQAFESGSAAMAVALGEARGRRGRTPEVDAFLRDQRALIADQRRHLAAQHRRLGLQHFSDRLTLALQALTVLVGVLLLGGVGWLAWRAHLANGVVIEAFTVPPDLATKGYSGQALASRIEDRLNELQAETWDVRPATTYTNSWGHEIKVEIPETGVSLSELDRLLRDWLGHETHVGGDLVRMPQGLSLTIRSGDGGAEVTGDETDMAALTQKAAEALYARTQPYRYGAYLQSKGRTAEARAAWQKLADEGTPEERAWALSGLAEVEQDPRVGEARAREALAINPNLAQAWLALGLRTQQLGDIPTMQAALGKAVALIQGRGHGGYSDRYVLESHRVAGALDTYTSNYFACAQEDRSGLALARESRVRSDLEDGLSFCIALLHETTAARAAVHNLSDVERMKALPDGGYVETDLISAFEDENWPELLSQAQAAYSVLTASSQPLSHYYAETRLRGMESTALLSMGRTAEGNALIQGFPADCQADCEGFRAYALEIAGDYAGADRLHAQAVRELAVPFNYDQWGRARLRHGDNDGAIAVFAQGVGHGAWYADNWQGWGEALLKKGDAAGAVAKFAEAEKSAPRWARLHRKWAEALARLGRRDEARAQLKTAAGMDLTPTERAELAAQRI